MGCVWGGEERECWLGVFEGLIKEGKGCWWELDKAMRYSFQPEPVVLPKGRNNAKTRAKGENNQNFPQ